MSKIYTAAVIGCGSIGGLKPSQYDFPGGTNILTHCHALWQHERTTLIAICDIDREKAKQAAKKWGCSALASTDDLFTFYRPDIIVIATPTDTHAKVLIDVLSHRPKLVIAEKPFCMNYEEAKVVVDAYEGAGIPIAVNYVRRYVPEIRKIRDEIANSEWGQVYHCQVNYNRGFMNDGSHAIDLCRWFFGEYIDSYFENGPHGNFIIDKDENDPTIYAHLEFDKCPHVFFCPSDGRKFDLFEIHIMMEKGRISFVDHSKTIAISRPLPETVYGNYPSLPGANEFSKTQMHTAMTYLVDNVVDALDEYLDDGEPLLLCSGKEALAVHRIYENIIK